MEFCMTYWALTHLFWYCVYSIHVPWPLQNQKRVWFPVYRIAGKFGKYFILAVWWIVKNHLIKLPIIEHHRYTHTMEYERAWYLQASLRKVCRETPTCSNSRADSLLSFKNSAQAAEIFCGIQCSLACQRLMAYNSPSAHHSYSMRILAVVLSRTQFSSSLVRKSSRSAC